ncbi:DUF5655 domain-containing protein [Ruania alba]|uniref:DUF5655 domain-containing protein n=1 Tax=Ruania alba TaxID=648782 RepID=A0A1H5CLU4_9MICO|nr:DUF5655 domain-containing protein [Ruania alba]SED67340.1 hypothetical protein SAMN04488554_0402 [Ruania alba]
MSAENEPRFAGWQQMVDDSRAILQRRTGADVAAWADRVRAAGAGTPEEARTWLAEQDVRGRGQDAVIWEMFGPPEFFELSGQELVDDQYADRPGLRPIAEVVFEIATGLGAQLQARKTYVSLRTGRRQFAQVVPAAKSALHLLLRLDVPADDRVEVLTPNKDQPLDRRVRLRDVTEVDDRVRDLLEAAWQQSW